MTRSGVDDAPPQVGAAFDAAVDAIEAAGAAVVDLDAEGFIFPPADGEFLVLLYDFKLDLQSYLATRAGVPMAGRTLADAIAFNTRTPRGRCRSSARRSSSWRSEIDTSSPDAPSPLFGGMTYNQALDSGQNVGVNGIDLALSSSTSTRSWPPRRPAWTTDLINADHFMFASSGLAAAPPAIRSCRCLRAWCSACRWASASSGPRSASLP